MLLIGVLGSVRGLPLPSPTPGYRQKGHPFTKDQSEACSCSCQPPTPHSLACSSSLLQPIPETHGEQPAHFHPNVFLPYPKPLVEREPQENTHGFLAKCLVSREQGLPNPRLRTGERSWGTGRGGTSGPHIPPCSASARDRSPHSHTQFPGSKVGVGWGSFGYR